MRVFRFECEIPDRLDTDELWREYSFYASFRFYYLISGVWGNRTLPVNVIRKFRGSSFWRADFIGAARGKSFTNTYATNEPAKEVN